MQSISPLVIVAGLFAVVLGVPFGLYALLTRKQRRTTSEVRTEATGRGWRYRRQRWQGNPTAFRIDGQSRSGLPWILTSGNSNDSNRGWTVQLVLRFPTLGGKTDLAVLPRGGESRGSHLLESSIPAEAQSRVAVVSGVLAGAIGFLRDAVEHPSDLSAFDAAYQVLVLPGQIWQAPVDRSLAEQILKWPADAIAPHAVRAWRDSFAFEVQARLPAPPNWPAVCYFVALGENLIARVPPPVKSNAPKGFVDRLISRLMK